MLSVWLAVAVISFATFVVEVTLALKQQASRPSAWLRKLASDIRNLLHQLGALFGQMADVIYFVRHLVRRLHAWFLYWIPLEVMTTALRDLLQPLKDLLRAPMAFVDGLNQSFQQSALPVITRIVFTFQFTGFVILWQLMTMVTDWTILRPSFLMGSGFIALGRTCYSLGYWLVTLADWSRFYAIAARVIETYAFPLFRKGIFDEVYQDLKAGLLAIRQVPQAFCLGAQEAFGLSTNQAVTVLVVSLGIFVGLCSCILYPCSTEEPEKKKEKKEGANVDGAGVLSE